MNFGKGLVFGLTVLLLVSVVGITGVGTFEEEGGANELMGDVIEIYTWEDLHNMRDNLTASYRLMNDLGPEDPGYDDYASEQADSGAGWLPIGDYFNRFTGLFDGQGYEIKGLYIYRPSTNYVGLFGYVVADGEVRNVGVGDVKVSGRNYVGGLVGRTGGVCVSNTGTVSTSYTTGNVTGLSYVGGLVGWNWGGTVSTSYATGNVSGINYVGGLVGANERQGTVSNSYATGDVSGEENVGGLVGMNYDSVADSYAMSDVIGTSNIGGLVGSNFGGTIENSYAVGNVSGEFGVGGLVGVIGAFNLDMGAVSNSYATGTVSGDWYVGGLVGGNLGTVTNTYATGSVSGINYVGGLVGDNWDGTVKTSYATGTVSGEGNVGGLVGDNWDGTVFGSFYHEDMPECPAHGRGSWSLNDEQFNSISTFESSGWDIETVDTERERPFLSWEVGGSDSTWHIRESNVTYELTIYVEGNGTTNPPPGTNTYYEHGMIVIEAVPDPQNYFSGWTGDITSEDSVISITMGDDINITAHFAEIDAEIYNWGQLNSIRLALSGEYTLMSDLDETTEGYDDYVDTGVGWEPLGSSLDNSFTGIFDGNGHEINGLYINRQHTDYVGLFGHVGYGGEVRNIGLVDVSVSGWDYVSGLVGYNSGTVENSYATGDMSGGGSVGGLVGYNSGTVDNSYATGDVSGWNYVGGLVGYNSGTVDNSYATGDVSGWNYVGGLVGDNRGTVSNSYATVDVSGGEYVGGLVGWNGRGGTVVNSYATGDVSGEEDVGGLVGLNWHGTVSNSYATGCISGNLQVGGLVGYNIGTVVNSYATGDVSGEEDVGGLVGLNWGTVENSFWDMDTGGPDNGAGVGKTTALMMDINTFTDAGWDIIGVADADERDISYIWNIVDTETYPFLSWQEEVHVPVLNELTIHSTDGGSVTTPGEGTYTHDYGTVVDLVATPATGYHFVEWTGDTGTIADPGEAETTITMEGDHTITAHFAINEHDLTIGSTEGGSVITPGEGTHTYDYGTVVDLVATPATNYHFVEWTGDIGTIADPGEAETTITMEGDHTITANFDMDKHDLTIGSTAGGSVTTPGEGTHTYDYGAVVDLVATPATGYHFVEWTGDTGTIADPSEAETTITIEGDHTITAHFAIDEHDLTIGSTEGGSVTTPGEGIHTYDYGTVVDLVATADTGYHFVEWTGDVGTIEDVNSSTTTITVHGDYDITAVFSEDVIEEDTFVLTVNTEGNGTVSMNPVRDEYAEGTDVTLTATAELGWVFVEWTGDATGTDEEMMVTMTGNKTITAVFQVEEKDDDGPPDDDGDDESGDWGMLMWVLPLVAIVVIVLALFMMKKKGGTGADGEPLDAEDEFLDDDILEEEDTIDVPEDE